MRIVHVNLSPPGYGGIERLLVDFLRYFRGSEFDVELCILSGGNDVSRDLSAQGYDIAQLDRRAGRFDWGLWRRLANHLRLVKCDVVHLHGNPGLTFGVPAAILAGRPRVVYTCHFSQSRHSAVRHALLGGLLRLVDSKVAVSDAARDILVRQYHQRRDSITVIRNGVDLQLFQEREVPTPGLPVEIGFCGLFRPAKQIPLLIEAVARLRGEAQSVRLSLVGDGVEMERCRQRAADLGISDIVSFHGSVMDVRKLVGRMDIFVLPSREEALPVALLEAMALGCAPVASRVGGIPEVIEDGKSGILVEPGDEQRLTAALRHLVTDRGERLRIGREARNRVAAEFSMETMMSRYAALYRRLQPRRSHL